MIPAFLAFAVIPFGTDVTSSGATSRSSSPTCQHRDPVGAGDGSLAVYGVVLAGWSSGSNYPLLGAVRSSAQMITYEVGMSLALVAVVMYSAVSLRIVAQIVALAQDLRCWNIVPQFPAFVAVPGRGARGDQPAAVRPAGGGDRAGGRASTPSTRASSSRCSTWPSTCNTVTVSAVAVTLFLGGWRGPRFRLPARGCGRCCGSC